MRAQEDEGTRGCWREWKDEGRSEGWPSVGCRVCIRQRGRRHKEGWLSVGCRVGVRAEVKAPKGLRLRGPRALVHLAVLGWPDEPGKQVETDPADIFSKVRDFPGGQVEVHGMNHPWDQPSCDEPSLG